MNIKSLLLGSAAALAVVSGAQAADAIVAAEPEPMEYVRVCDAFGTGYFYIPGTETCLKIGGEVRFAYDWSKSDGTDFDGNFETRARLVFEAMNDSEIGTIGSYIRIQANSDDSDVVLDKAYLTVGGFKAGYTTTFADDIGIAGENDAFIDAAKFDMVSYTYSTDAFTIGLGVDELSNTGFDDLGVEAMASASLGAATVALYGGYDFDAEEGFVVAQLSADIGPGSLGVYGGWASDPSTYVTTYEWTVGAAYTLKATEKLSITPSVNYFSEFGGDDYFGAGVLASYQIASGLSTEVTVDYKDTATNDWTGFVRLIRSF
ncbi:MULTISPECIES: porin [Rhizobium]|uniref:Porin n=1 Tax=Rhizobium wuzhouense TaxID=1986026 RepID=A0ABX5NUR2_9HYPH|nr:MULTISPECIES: porin [Rhizobium]PYB76835.1 porin [Rhizobium wuzhouense]RKE85428.1 porin-like protein [Rhizobium sp. AG855]